MTNYAIADDESYNRELFYRMVQKYHQDHGLSPPVFVPDETYSIASGEALEGVLCSLGVDVIITDNNMHSRVNGVQAVMNASARVGKNFGARTVLVSGDVFPDGLPVVAHVLRKPMRVTDFFAALDDLLRSSCT